MRVERCDKQEKDGEYMVRKANRKRNVRGTVVPGLEEALKQLFYQNCVF